MLHPKQVEFIHELIAVFETNSVISTNMYLTKFQYIKTAKSKFTVNNLLYDLRNMLRDSYFNTTNIYNTFTSSTYVGSHIYSVRDLLNDLLHHNELLLHVYGMSDSSFTKCNGEIEHICKLRYTSDNNVELEVKPNR